MPFLTKEKTNWKYILIISVLAVIVGRGILGYLRYFGLDKDGLEGGEGRGIFSQNSNNL
jgi:hypothetical protein